MKRASFWLSLALILGFAALLLTYPQEAAESARFGLSLCARLIIPSLFPFFVLSSLLISLGFAELLGKLLQRLIHPLFHLHAPCAGALVLGALGGYPVGARMTAQLYESGRISAHDARRLSLFVNNCGPAFLFSVAGCGIFGSKSAGFLLVGTHLAAALLLGIFLRFLPSAQSATQSPAAQPSAPPALSSAFPICVRDSFAATLNICAFVVFFSVLLQLLDCSGLLPQLAQILARLSPAALSPAVMSSLLRGFLEISCGVSSLVDLRGASLALPLAAFMLGWGGLSVHCQTLPYLQSCHCPLRPYLLAKLAQGLLATLLTAVLTPIICTDVTTAMLPLEALSPVALPLGLIGQEFVALWALSGVYCLIMRKKGLVKNARLLYNRSRNASPP